MAGAGLKEAAAQVRRNCFSEYNVTDVGQSQGMLWRSSRGPGAGFKARRVLFSTAEAASNETNSAHCRFESKRS